MTFLLSYKVFTFEDAGAQHSPAGYASVGTEPPV